MKTGWEMNFAGYSEILDNQFKKNVNNFWIEVYKTSTFINVFYSNATGRNMSVGSEKLCRLYTIKRESQTMEISNFQVYIQTRKQISLVFYSYVFKKQFHMQFFRLSTHQSIFWTSPAENLPPINQVSTE
jgi:hypothetical protein